MLRPQACKLNLLGVQEAFDLNLQAPKTEQALRSISLFPTCVLTPEDLQVCEPHETTPLSVKAWTDLQSHATGCLRPGEAGPQMHTLNLLLCNTLTTSSTSGEPPSHHRLSPLTTAQWRTRLNEESGIPFEVIYGQGQELIERIRFAWSAALRNWGLSVQEERTRPPVALRFTAYCEKCSDPQCERHLFSLNRMKDQCN